MGRYLTICATSILLAGCFRPGEPPPVEVDEALFCDLVPEDFRWTQEIWDARLTLDPANLRREIEINQHREAECQEPAP